MRSIDGEVYSFNIFKAPSAIPSAGGAFCSFLHCRTVVFVDKAPPCYYNNVVKMASLRGFAPARIKYRQGEILKWHKRSRCPLPV